LDIMETCAALFPEGDMIFWWSNKPLGLVSGVVYRVARPGNNLMVHRKDESGPQCAAEDTSAEEMHEQLVNVNATCQKRDDVDNLLPLSRYSSFSRAKRITALILRFIKKIISKGNSDMENRIPIHIPELADISDGIGSLCGREVRAARLALIRNHQLVYLNNDYKKSMDNTLRLYQDAQGVWRSKGRLGNSSLHFDAKNPIFVTPNTVLSSLIIQEAHGNYHRGIEHTISTVREQYWIPKLRQQVRKLIAHCVKCCRFNALPYRYPETTDLPQRRVMRCRPFQHTGLDFFDLPSCSEGGNQVKLYGCIFTCTVTRLIHLEVVRSMAVGDFLNALRRFIARKGVPESITCDNAPTFLLSGNILKNFQALQYRQQVVDAFHSSCQITEKFWNIWQQQYLTSLRETHKRLISDRRLVNDIPTVGDIVLVSDPVLPRNEWKMARIIATRQGADGAVREAELLTATKRKIRRPVNLLIPLEIPEDRSSESGNTSKNDSADTSPEPKTQDHGYNLRPRRPINYIENNVNFATTPRCYKHPTYSRKWFLFHIMVISMLQLASGNVTEFTSMSCANEGILVHAAQHQEYEICAGHCVKFPPEVTLHDFKATFKWHTKGQLTVMEMVCQGLDFCANVDCWICASVLLNPECWPFGAILVGALSMYGIIAFVYVFLYVPIIVVTMTMVTLPPTPKLNSVFITDGNNTGIWTGIISPALHCNSWTEAVTMNCTFSDDCKCNAAESKVVCHCSSSNLEEEFDRIHLKLPLKTASWEIEKRIGAPLTVKIPHLVSSEIFVTFNKTLHMAIEDVQNQKCTIENTSLQGRYHCAKGAFSNVRCKSELETFGEILCADNTFVVPCGPSSPKSTLHFHFDSALQLLKCAISCGEEKFHFHLSGVLKYITSIHPRVLSRIDGKSSSYEEFQWPDLDHIADVLFTWYKTLLIVLAILAISLIFSYILINAYGLRFLWLVLRIIRATCCWPLRTTILILRLLKDRYSRQKRAQKLA
uniref:Integrase catalytic domain-containing protein n=1 Tax=Heligmosomoides polygyrus TaxID=6339 RepID=A0A8L8KTV9_HELPZ